MVGGALGNGSNALPPLNNFKQVSTRLFCTIHRGPRKSRTRLVGAKSVGAPEDRNQLWEACLFTHKEYVTLVMKKRAACSAMMSPNYLVFFFNEITQHSRISKIRMIFSLLHL